MFALGFMVDLGVIVYHSHIHEHAKYIWGVHI